MKPEDRKRLKQHIEMIVEHKIPSNVVFCPNCEKDTECIHTAELYECKDCGEDFAKYIVSRKPADVSMTQDVLTDIKTGQSIENTNPDYYKQEIARLTAELAELKSEIVSKDKKLTDYEKELRKLHNYDKTCSTCRYLDENQDCVLGIRCVNYALWQGRIL